MLVDPQNQHLVSTTMQRYVSATVNLALAPVNTALNIAGSVLPWNWENTCRTLYNAASAVINKGIVTATKDSLADAWNATITQPFKDRAELISETGNKVIDKVPQEQSPQKTN